MEYHDIPYAPSSHPNKLLQFDLYLPDPNGAAKRAASPLICYVHGGAWRSEDKADHSGLARKLVSSTQFAVVVPNYRLTSKDPQDQYYLLQHPAHTEDLLQFLNFIVTWEGPEGLHRDSTTSQAGGQIYDPSRLYLIGHSCSAHMLSTIFLDSSAITPSLTPPSPLYGAVQAIVMSAGIYDIDLLLAKFPAYRGWFIESAFGQRESFVDFSVTRYPQRTEDARIRWLIIHSQGDTLIDVHQSEVMHEHLYALHQVVGVPPESLVSIDTDTLQTEGHYEIPDSNEYARLVSTYILQDLFPHST